MRRRRSEPPDKYRTAFEVDIDRITECKAFRRLKYKTQVIWTPRDAHFRTRLTHTLDVVNIARTIASCIGLNPQLVEAIAYGHDIGHPPFGHAGERALKKYIQDKIGASKDFDHHEQAVRILQEQEKLYTGPQK